MRVVSSWKWKSYVAEKKKNKKRGEIQNFERQEYTKNRPKQPILIAANSSRILRGNRERKVCTLAGC
jgi:hypothetical protein